jgi:glycosyltransferase involved in cell wall biosynthesis
VALGFRFQRFSIFPVTVLLLNQTFYPDVMATGQYLSELATRLVECGHEVTVVTSRRAYDNPERRFPQCEVWRGVRIFRVGSTGFGKGAKWRRAADFATFLLTAIVRLALLPRHDVVVALTSPPLISVLGAGVALVRRSAFVYWVMDFNPDEAVAAGWLRADSLLAKVLDRVSCFSLRHARKVIALDRFMRDRIMAKGIAPEKVITLPPWSHDGEVRFDSAGRERFRREHGLGGKFVVMYSGNHSPCHPLDTLLAAARELAADPGIVFCFVGGGSEWRKIAEKQEAESRKQNGDDRGREPGSRPSTLNPQPSTPNILCLPYQPLDQLAGSLSAGDLHVVVMGDPFVGLVHPCKIYNVLSVGAPVLYIGPQPSHLSEILSAVDGQSVCAMAAHGEVDRVVQLIQRIRHEGFPTDRRPSTCAGAAFSKEAILPRLIAELESV